MLDLLVKRFAVSKEIGSLKAVHNLNVEDPNRESEIIDRLTNKLEGKLDRNDIDAIFSPIYKLSKKLQS
ncbi:MAG: chorismate mutase [Candidatus Marinimicrobia bacterium]|nr:chorismate mutase [Candidatus Neomarinimicrobiota bacterium]